MIHLFTCIGAAVQLVVSPQNQTVPVNSVVRFTCRTTGFLVWQIDNVQLFSNNPAAANIHSRGIRVDSENQSVLLANATLRNNQTRILCLTGPELNVTSKIALLIVFGEWWSEYLTACISFFTHAIFILQKQIIQLLPLMSLCCHWSHLLSHGFLHLLFLELTLATLLISPTWTQPESSVLVN